MSSDKSLPLFQYSRKQGISSRCSSSHCASPLGFYNIILSNVTAGNGINSGT